MSAAAINIKELRASVGYRKVVPPKPEALPACKNCEFYACDHDDREGSKGVYFQIINSRCKSHSFSVARNTVCDTHQFRCKDRRDV